MGQSIYNKVKCNSPAPSAAPASVRISIWTTLRITLQWGAVDCIHRNGDITGYSVQYGVVGSGSTHMISVSGNSFYIYYIQTSTNYFIQVAAVNSAGIGVYSDPILFQAPKGMCIKTYTYTQ